MRINTNGPVSIGNINNTYPLEVTGDINFTGNLRSNGIIYNPGTPSIISETTNDIFYVGSNYNTGTDIDIMISAIHNSKSNVSYIRVTNSNSPSSNSNGLLGLVYG